MLTMQAAFDLLVIFIFVVVEKEWRDLEFVSRDSRQTEGCHGNCLLVQQQETVCKVIGGDGIMTKS